MYTATLLLKKQRCDIEHLKLIKKNLTFLTFFQVFYRGDWKIIMSEATKSVIINKLNANTPKFTFKEYFYVYWLKEAGLVMAERLMQGTWDSR